MLLPHSAADVAAAARPHGSTAVGRWSAASSVASVAVARRTAASVAVAVAPAAHYRNQRQHVLHARPRAT